MKQPNFNSFVALLDDAGRALATALRYGARFVTDLSWPSLLGACVALALVITVLPLALFLFIALMAAKVAVALLASRKRILLPSAGDGK